MTGISRFEGSYSWLSNFAPYGFKEKLEEEHWLRRSYCFGFKDGERTWPTVEHYYQACKAWNINDFVKIYEAETPALAKKLGRRVSIRRDWEAIHLNVMFFALTQKFSQNKELLYRLKSTGKIDIVEGNYWHDNYWGKCLCSECRFKEKFNHLGRMLMYLRETL